MWKRVVAALSMVIPAVFAGMGSAAAQKITIGVLKLASSAPVFIAQDKGYFAGEGLQAELKFFEAAQPVSVATVSGDVDVGVTGLTAGFFNLAGKGALKIIGAQSREEPGYPLGAYLASNAAYEAGLRSLKDLGGRSIAITQTGSTFHYSLGLLAEKYHFDLSAIRLVPLQSMGNMASALTGGQVEAALIPGTLALPMVNRGEAKLLGWIGDETPWQLGALFSATRTVASRRADLQKFIHAYQKGAQDYYDAFLVKGQDGKPVAGGQAPALLDILVKYTGQPADQLRTGLPFIDPHARLLVKDIYRQVAWYQSQGLVDKGVAAADILDLSFVQGHLDMPQ
jgi:NitT/TauT family transport system substrate-binding protein